MRLLQRLTWHYSSILAIYLVLNRHWCTFAQWHKYSDHLVCLTAGKQPVLYLYLQLLYLGSSRNRSLCRLQGRASQCYIIVWTYCYSRAILLIVQSSKKQIRYVLLRLRMLKASCHQSSATSYGWLRLLRWHAVRMLRFGRRMQSRGSYSRYGRIRILVSKLH